MAAVMTDSRSIPNHNVTERIERLSAVSVKRVIEPDDAVAGHIGDGALLPPELLSTAGLDLDLTPDQLAKLSREEIGSITDAGVRFEAVLLAGFALEIAGADDLTDPRIVYALHELGEENVAPTPHFHLSFSGLCCQP